MSDTDVLKVFPKETKPYKQPYYYPKIPLSDEDTGMNLLDGELG